ncbi:MAG: asparagine synthase-related protein [bacterium]|nr:asparagine synthase-related protein [bacterium]
MNPIPLGAMVEAMAHRGPDGRGSHVSGSIGMSHLLLATTPHAVHEQMPARSSDGRLLLTGDLRLDDREELWRAFGRGEPFDPQTSDSRLVLLAYDKWGEACPEHLLGDFAFVLWDGRESKFFMARDQFGLKPFFYHLSGSVFAAASELKALLPMDSVGRDIDERWIVDFLAVLQPEADATVNPSIRRLPPATTMVLTPAGMRKRVYWRLDPARTLPMKKDADYFEAYRELFLAAVRRRVVSTGPVGSFLSGGLDSSSIVCAARHMLPGDPALHTFSAWFSDTPESDESRFIKVVLSGGRLADHWVDASESGPLSFIEETLEALDEPRLAYNYYYIWRLARAAREAGIHVMLDGFDGDTTLTHGEGLFAQWAREGRWLRLHRESKAYCALRHIAYRDPGAYIWRYGLRPRIPGPAANLARRIRASLRPARVTPEVPGAKTRYNLIPRDVGLRHGVEERTRAMFALDPPDHKRSHLRRLESTLFPYTIESIQAVQAAFGTELRLPFFDRRLVEFCLAQPERLKMVRGKTRVLAREGLADILPDEIRQRQDKSDMSVGYRANLMKHNRALVLDTLASPGRLADRLDVSHVGRLLARFDAGQCTNGELMLVWRLICLKTWLNRAEPATAAVAIGFSGGPPPMKIPVTERR